MLVLTRHRDEQIVIGEDIIVKVLEIRGDRVRIGISAPLDVEVNRFEVKCRIDAERSTNNGTDRTT